jgi:hypothetical protein
MPLNDYNFNTIDMGLGGFGNTLSDQVRQQEEERKRKAAQAANNTLPNQANAAGLGLMNQFAGGIRVR